MSKQCRSEEWLMVKIEENQTAF